MLMMLWCMIEASLWYIVEELAHLRCMVEAYMVYDLGCLVLF
jgi:hypothetical protein